jgi:Protein of unknown function (DUF4242)
MYTSPSPKVQQSVADVAAAHEADLKTQIEYGVRYMRYWLGEKDGKVFCLAEAPNADAAITVHRQAHGMVANQIYEVIEGS